MNKKSFRFKLNLFDGIVLALALCVALVLGYLMLKPAAPRLRLAPPPSPPSAIPSASRRCWRAPEL